MAAPPLPATHLILVRHGESLSNRDGAGAGPDAGLTELGWRQSQAVADWLARHTTADALVSSTLERARQTAHAISQRTGLPVVELPGIEETDQSYWEELPFHQTDPLVNWDNPWRLEPARAPIYAAFRARLRQAMARLLEDYAGRTVIVVTHGGAIGTIMRGLFGGQQVTVYTDNTGVTHLAWEAGSWRLISHNRTDHLAPLRPCDDPSPSLKEQGLANGGVQFDAIRQHFDRLAAVRPGGAELSGERDLRQLVRLAAPRPSDRVLDAATGSGAVALAFAPHVAAVLGIDLSPAMLEVAERSRALAKAANVRFRLGEIGSIALPQAGFEIVVCHDLLRYTADMASLFTRFRGLLAAGGRLVLDELIGSDDPVKRATHHAIELRRDPALSRIWAAAEIIAALAAAGYRVETTQRYAEPHELREWLDRAAADEATRSAVLRMITTGMEADAAGLAVRYGRDGQITFTHSRARILALPRNDQPAA